MINFISNNLLKRQSLDKAQQLTQTGFRARFSPTVSIYFNLKY